MPTKQVLGWWWIITLITLPGCYTPSGARTVETDPKEWRIPAGTAALISETFDNASARLLRTVPMTRESNVPFVTFRNGDHAGAQLVTVTWDFGIAQWNETFFIQVIKNLDLSTPRHRRLLIHEFLHIIWHFSEVPRKNEFAESIERLNADAQAHDSAYSEFANHVLNLYRKCYAFELTSEEALDELYAFAGQFIPLCYSKGVKIPPYILKHYRGILRAVNDNDP